jgi:hypothetical protein
VRRRVKNGGPVLADSLVVFAIETAIMKTPFLKIVAGD